MTSEPNAANSEWSSKLLGISTRYCPRVETFGELHQRYYWFYLDEVPPHGALTPYEEEFFGDIHERLDYTDVDPDAESRAHGWINRDKYLDWARERRHLFLIGRP